MFIIDHKRIFFSVSALFIAVSVFSMIALGFNLGIDFTGGSIIEVSYEEAPAHERVVEAAETLITDSAIDAQPLGEDGYLIRTRFLADAEREELSGALLSLVPEGGATIERVSSVGPTVGNELASKALIAMVLVLLVIVLFVAYSFRKVSEPVSSWIYGLVAILALVHDVVVTTGVFVLFGFLTGAEIDILFVTALLAILGFSVNDTIVVFDRIRENLSLQKEKKKNKESFERLVGRSLDETFTRSFNTSFAALLVIGSLYFLGGEATKNFALTLGVGTIFGAYSSLFVASPLLIAIQQFQARRSAAGKKK